MLNCLSFKIKVQKTIESFFTYDRDAAISKQSKRMVNAIHLFKNKVDTSTMKKDHKATNDDFNLSEDEDDSEKVAIKGKTKNSRTKDKVQPRKKNPPRTSTKVASSSFASAKNDHDDDAILIEGSDSEDTNRYNPGKRKSTDSVSEEKSKNPQDEHEKKEENAARIVKIRKK